jgi:hypothetical protein
MTESDEAVLSDYQTRFSPTFPFVVFPDGTKAEALKRARPFLFAAIRMVTSVKNQRAMRGQMHRLMAHVSDRVLMQSGTPSSALLIPSLPSLANVSERSLDLLLGILVMTAWYQYFCVMHAQMNNLVGLAVSLAADLNLTRPPRVVERTNLMVLWPHEPLPR